jgi:prepilin-type N-terminal cleavage/methylation domain-containing protein
MARMIDRKAITGFTLIETVASLAILATLIYLASVSLLGMAPKYKLEKGVWEIRAALNAARAKAILESVDFRVKIEPAGYQMEKRGAPANPWTMETRRTLEGVACSANNMPVFTPEGAVTGLATITVTNSWGGYKITLAITGRIKTTRLY